MFKSPLPAKVLALLPVVLLAAGIVVQLRLAAAQSGASGRPGLVGVEIASEKEAALVVYAADGVI